MSKLSSEATQLENLIKGLDGRIEQAEKWLQNYKDARQKMRDRVDEIKNKGDRSKNG